MAFTAPSSGASATFAGSVTTAVTGVDGTASSVAVTANTTARIIQHFSEFAQRGGTASLHADEYCGYRGDWAVTGGSGQSAAVNTAFQNTLIATVKDSGGNPVSGVTVTFAVPGTGASATFTGSATAVTGANGQASSSTLMANATLGTYTVTASTSGAGTAASFSLTNTAGAPASIIATSGSPQSAVINAAFSNPLVATVKDASGNPASGITVTFAGPATGASVNFGGGAFSITAVTASNGQASVTGFTGNAKAGSYNVIASVAGLGTTATFTLTNLTGPPAAITFTSGGGQSATVNTAFGKLMVATVTDAGGNLVSGASVTFTAPATGASGSFTGSPTVVTIANGQASSPTFTANTIVGAYSVTASAGVTTPATFLLTNTVGAVSSIAVSSGSGQTTATSAAFTNPLAAIVKDSFGNPVPGVAVTFTPPASGPGGAFTTVNTAITNASGVATSTTFTANATAGAFTVTASASGAATPAVFSLTNSTGMQLPANVTVPPGQTVSFPVTLAAPAISSVFITLSSSDTSKVTVTPAFIIPAGATAPLTAPRVNGISNGSATITATSSSYPTVTQTVLSADTVSFSPASLTLNGGATQQLFLVLSGPAPAGGVSVNLSSSNTGVATVPASATFNANTTIVNVPVTGVAAGLATIHASAANVADATASVTVTGLAITTTSLNAGQVGTAYSQTLAATGGTAPYNWSITSGALPSGLTLNAASGQIIGTPSTTAANLPLTIHVIDSSSPALGANASTHDHDRLRKSSGVDHRHRRDSAERGDRHSVWNPSGGFRQGCEQQPGWGSHRDIYSSFDARERQLRGRIEYGGDERFRCRHLRTVHRERNHRSVHGISGGRDRRNQG